MTTPRRLTDGRSSGYGCGQSIRDRGRCWSCSTAAAVSGFGARNALIPASRSAVAVMANADWAGGVLDAIETAVLAKLMPVADAPTVAGPPGAGGGARPARQIRAGEVEPGAARRRVQRLPHAGAARGDVEVACRRRRGERGQAGPDPRARRHGGVVAADAWSGTTPIRTLMYRRPTARSGVPVQPTMSDAARRICSPSCSSERPASRAELLLLGHVEDFNQLIPLGLAAATLLAEPAGEPQANCRDGAAVSGGDGCCS